MHDAGRCSFAISRGSESNVFRVLVVVAGLSLGLAGCSTPYDGPGSENRSTTVATGCVLLGILGAVAGAIADGGRGAAIGAGAGCAAGAATGYAVARRSEQAASTEQTLERRIAAADKNADIYAERSAANVREIQQLRQQVLQLNRQLAQNRLSPSEYNSRIQPIQQRINALSQQNQETETIIRQLSQDQEVARASRDTSYLQSTLDRYSRDYNRERTQLEQLQQAIRGTT